MRFDPSIQFATAGQPVWLVLLAGAAAGALMWRQGESATERLTPDMTPAMVGVHHSQAVDAFRIFWKQAGPVYVMRRVDPAVANQTVQPVEFDPRALYLWVDDDGVVVDGGSWDAISEPLFHGGMVELVAGVVTPPVGS